MAYRRKRKFSKKEIKAQKKEEIVKQGLQSQTQEQGQVEPQKPGVGKTVELPKILTVREFSQRLGLPVTKVIEELLKNSIMASINESIDYDTAAIMADELGYDVLSQKEEELKITKEKKEDTSGTKDLQPRPPVVVVLGHVDHGKTTLLDQIRKTHVAQGESGGITQHIGAYQVKIQNSKSRFAEADKNQNNNEKFKNIKSKKDKKDKDRDQNEKRTITFLDTPGHEAFSAMRAHGANITDVVVLVVAADDGVMPQTKEAISHAKAANVPIIVAINKIDKPDANLQKTKQQLAESGLNPEEWGGNTVVVEISAKQGKGISELLDMILLTSDLMELKADYNCRASGVVIESHMQAGMGPVATVLVQKGKLKLGDPLIIGSTYGKIKAMMDYQGRRINSATPSMPVQISGLNLIPNFGDRFEVTNSEKDAKLFSQANKMRRKSLGLTDFSKAIKEGKIKTLNIILKADVDGSLEAIKDSISTLSSHEVGVKILHLDVGSISESDINLALASNALVIGFRIKISPSAKNLAKIRGVKISIYDVIYKLLEDLQAVLSGMLEPEIVEVSIGKLEVLKVFKELKGLKVVGGKVFEGKMIKREKVKVFHSQELLSEGILVSLQKEKNPQDEVEAGLECGLGIEIKSPIKVGDIIEAYRKEEKVRRMTQ